MTDQTGLSDIEKRIRDQLRKGGLNGPSDETSKPQVRRAAPSLGASPTETETPQEKPMPEIIERGSPLAAGLGVTADRTDPVMEDALPRTAITTKPQLAVKEKVVDDRFLALEDLPSNFHPYEGVKKLLIRPFAVNELKLVARSIETGDSDYIAQAIDNCIDMPVANLTIPDYFYLYYWMRIQSYPNTPHYMEWKCDEVHSHGECGNENVTPLTHKELKVIYLNDLGFKPEDLDPRLDFPRVSLLQDLTLAQESKNAIKENRNSEATFSLDELVLDELT